MNLLIKAQAINSSRSKQSAAISKCYLQGKRLSSSFSKNTKIAKIAVLDLEVCVDSNISESNHKSYSKALYICDGCCTKLKIYNIILYLFLAINNSIFE